MGGGLFLNLRDFAKFGQVMLDEGKWQGKQVISNQWISKIWNNGRAIEPEGDSLMYSYGWWLKKIKYNGKIYNLATASGNGGQKIMVVKELSLVFAMFGNGYNEPFFEEEQPVKILKNHLLTVQGNEETNPDHMTEKEMKALGYKVIDYIVDHRLNFDAEKVSNIGSYASLSKQVKEEIPINGESPQAVFEELNAFIKDNIVHLDHPRLFSFIPGPSNYYSILADTLATGYNVFAGHWLGGSAAAMIESRTTEWLKHIAGYPKGSGGLFVSGGSMANLTAIVAARTNKLQDDYAKGTIYYSEQTHSSLSKALRAIGFQKQHMRKISTQDNFQIDISALRKALKEDVAAGYVPCCIIGNAGTTNTGAIDGPNELAAIARQYNAWFHIDAAYGGATLLSEPYKEQVSGIEKADSITLDPHKWWFQPYEMGCLLVKDKKTLKASFAVHAEYLDDTIKDEKEINYYDYGVQLSRSFRALKLYTFFRCKGLTKIGDYVTQGIKNAEYLEELFNDKAYWEVLSKPSIGIISFRAKIDALDNDALNAEISQHVSESGYAMITTTKLKGHLALRMCPIHPETTKEHLSKTVALMNVFIENKIT